MLLLRRATWHISSKLLFLYSYDLYVIIHFDRCLLHVIIWILLLFVIYRAALVPTCQTLPLIIWFQWLLIACGRVVVSRYIYSFNFKRWAWLLLIIHIYLFNLDLFSSCFNSLQRILLLFFLENVISYFWMPVLPSRRLLTWWLIIMIFLTSSLIKNHRLIMFFFGNLLKFLIGCFLLLFLDVFIILTFR